MWEEFAVQAFEQGLCCRRLEHDFDLHVGKLLDLAAALTARTGALNRKMGPAACANIAQQLLHSFQGIGFADNGDEFHRGGIHADGHQQVNRHPHIQRLGEFKVTFGKRGDEAEHKEEHRGRKQVGADGVE